MSGALGTSGLRLERDGPIAWCVIDRPAARNALTPAMYYGLKRAVRLVNADPDLAALIVTGVGDVFAPGGDLGGRTEPGDGFEMVSLSEHHGSDDGYCPSPVVLAAAICGRTRSLRILVAALVLPLYDPIRLAEDLAVLDLASGGRVDLVIGAGYRPEELAMFGREMDDRVALVEEGVAALRSAWSGEAFDYRGRRIRVTPRPARPRGPVLLMAGATRYTPTDDAESLRASGSYAVLTPDECVTMARATGALRLHPLMGGLPPELAWDSLELVASKVLPQL